ncbi:MAG: hypothetical protein AB1758_23035, partial [Candidatus Eremiobacterota bacterium]
FVRWGELKYHAEGATVQGDRPRPFMCVRCFSFEPPGPSFNFQEADCEPIEGDYERPDDVLAALSFVSGQLDQALRQWVELRSGLVTGSRTRAVLYRWPRNLLGWVWLCLAQDLEPRLPVLRACERCGRSFVGRGRARCCPASRGQVTRIPRRSSSAK